MNTRSRGTPPGWPRKRQTPTEWRERENLPAASGRRGDASALRWLGIAAVLLSAIVAMPTKAAATCSLSSHCYAIVYAPYVNNAGHGAAADIRTDSLSSARPATNFVNHEMWYGLNGSGSFWVEVGFKSGVTYASGSVYHRLFWADNRNGGGYHEHFPSYGWRIGSWYRLQVSRAGNCAWNVYVSGTRVGTSTSNCAGGSRDLNVGLEATEVTRNDHGGGASAGWASLDANNRWHSGFWQNASLLEDSPTAIHRYSGYTYEVLHGPL